MTSICLLISSIQILLIDFLFPSSSFFDFALLTLDKFCSLRVIFRWNVLESLETIRIYLVFFYCLGKHMVVLVYIWVVWLKILLLSLNCLQNVFASAVKKLSVTVTDAVTWLCVVAVDDGHFFLGWWFFHVSYLRLSVGYFRVGEEELFLWGLTIEDDEVRLTWRFIGIGVLRLQAILMLNNLFMVVRCSISKWLRWWWKMHVSMR